MTGSTRCWQVRGHGSLLGTQCVALIASWCQSFSTSELQVKWKPISASQSVSQWWEGRWPPHWLGWAQSCHLSCRLHPALPPPTSVQNLTKESKYSNQELSSLTSRSPRVSWTSGPTSGRCTSLMPSFSPIPLIRCGDAPGLFILIVISAVVTGHHQHLQGSAWSENRQTWRAGLSQIHNFCALNARSLRFFTKLYCISNDYDCQVVFGAMFL